MDVDEEIEPGRAVARLSATDKGFLFAGAVALATMILVPLIAGVPFDDEEWLGLASFVLLAGVFVVEHSVLRVELRIENGRVFYRNPWLPLIYRGSLALEDVHRVRLGARSRGKGRLQLVDVRGGTHNVHLVAIDEAAGVRVAKRWTELLDSARTTPLSTTPPLVAWSESTGRGSFACELRAPRRRRIGALLTAPMLIVLASGAAWARPVVVVLPIGAVAAYMLLRRSLARVRVTIDARGIELARMWLGAEERMRMPLDGVTRLSIATRRHRHTSAFLITLETFDGRAEELPWEFDDHDDAEWVRDRLTRGLEAVRAHAEYR